MQKATESDSTLRREVAELLRMGPRRGVPHLLSEFRKQHLSGAPRGLETIIRALCAQNSTWIAQFKQRIGRRAGCPADLKRTIRGALSTLPTTEEPRARLTAQDVLRRARVPRSSAELIIKDKSELGFGDGYRQFLAKLHDLAARKQTPLDLVVRFECAPVYVHGLALLAAWCERYTARVRLVAVQPDVERYLEAIGIKRVLEEQVTIDAPLYDGRHHVALTRVEREDQHAADEVARRIVDLFARHIGLEKANETALTIMFAELVENVYRHASSNFGSYVMAQAFPKPQKLHLVVADTGIGVYASFCESDSAEARQRATSEQAAIEMALEKLVTSKTRRHAGYGLFVVRRLVERNVGQLRITSGRVTKQFEATRARWGRMGYNSTISSHLPWNGTEVSLIFDMSRPLPLEEVYAELGPPDRAEDFFE